MRKDNSAIAPSEQHLEDWLCEHPQSPYNGAWGDRYILDRLLSRQVRYSGGIIDIIGVLGCQVRVIELKKGIADSRALVQVLSYVQHVRQVFNHFAANMWAAGRLRGEYGFMVTGRPFIQAILIAYEFEPRTFLAAFDAGVIPIEYAYDRNGYSFGRAFTCDTLYTPDGLGFLHAVIEKNLLQYEARTGEQS